MTITFEAKTTDSYVLKNLFELFQYIVKYIIIEITAEGMKVRFTDANKIILVDMFLNANKFQKYRFDSSHKMCISVISQHLYKMIKCVKKRDTTIFFIDDQRIGEFGIKVIPRDGDQRTTSYLKMQISQNVEITMPDGYKDSVLVTPAEFSKFVKDATTVGNDIQIYSNKYQLKVVCSGAIFTKEIIFGDSEYDGDYDNKELYSTEYFNKLSKLTCMGNNIQFYTKEKFPLMLKTQVGSLGDLTIYVKSKDQIEKCKAATVNGINSI